MVVLIWISASTCANNIKSFYISSPVRVLFYVVKTGDIFMEKRDIENYFQKQ